MKKKYINRWLLYVPFKLRSKNIFSQKARAESQLVCTDVNVSACRGVATLRFLLMCTVSKMKSAQQTVFFLQQRSHEEKQMTVILVLELTNTTSCSSSESDDQTIRPTVSTAVATFTCCMRRQSSL